MMDGGSLAGTRHLSLIFFSLLINSRRLF